MSIHQGLWAALLILELFDPEFRALFKAKLAKVAGSNTKALSSLELSFFLQFESLTSVFIIETHSIRCRAQRLVLVEEV